MWADGSAREARRADLPAEHTGSRRLRRRRAVLPAIVAPTPSRVVARRCPRLRVAHRALMTLRALPSWACLRVSRSCSLAGVRPRLAGRSAAPPVCTEGSGPCAPPSSHALPCWRMPDAELSACWTAACSISACASRCRFRASGVEVAGMARNSVAVAMSFWLSRGGVLTSSTLKSALMRSRACRPNSRVHSPRAEASPAMDARSSRTARYSSASLASSSRAWANCALTSAPLGGEEGGALGPAPRHVRVPEPGVTSPSPASAALVAFA
jgi:hypothetical protein